MRPNDTIGPYKLVSKLGRGAFGVVWLAEKSTAITTTKVAIKIPTDEDVDLEAVKQEASVWVHASGHPNVLPIIDADIYDEQVIIVSEYAPDGSLSKWLERHGGKAPDVESAVEMTLGILAGLEHLHERGIIHRDLKPDNILLQRETPRLADFGIARILKITSKSTIATGTPVYMPPEAFDGKRSEQTDIWSAGVICYQLLSGRLPFPQTDTPSLLMAIITREFEPLPDSIPQSIREVVKRALEKALTERFESASDMRKALRQALRPQTPATSSEVKTEVLPLKDIGLQPTLIRETPRQRRDVPSSTAAATTMSLPVDSSTAEIAPSDYPQHSAPNAQLPRKSKRLTLIMSSVAGLILIAILAYAGLHWYRRQTSGSGNNSNEAATTNSIQADDKVKRLLPPPNGYVNDFANIIDPESKYQLEKILNQLKKQRDIEFSVTTIKTTGGRPISNYAMTVANEWGISGASGGILLLVAVDDLQYQFSITRRLQGKLPHDLLAEYGELMKPSFKSGQFGQGILKAVDAVITRLGE